MQDPFDIRPEKQIGDITVPGCFLVPTNDDYINCANGYHMANMYGGIKYILVYYMCHIGVITLIWFSIELQLIFNN